MQVHVTFTFEDYDSKNDIYFEFPTDNTSLGFLATVGIINATFPYHLERPLDPKIGLESKNHARWTIKRSLCKMPKVPPKCTGTSQITRIEICPFFG